MLGMGKKRPSGSPDEAERTLFRELGDKQDQGGRRSRRRYAGLAVLVFCLAVGATIVPLASSVNPDIADFELDGNIVQDSATTPPDDWATIINASGNPTGLGSALSTDFVDDPIGPTDKAYGSGSNKDINDISTWSWATSTVTPGKDNIGAAYAAVYVEDGNEILYFGQERALDDKGGDANMGFWFLKDPTVGINANGTFNGHHQVGDILIQSSLTNGGGISEIHVFKWNGSGITEITGLAEGACTGGKLGTQNACGIANTSPITRPWNALPLGAPYFFEGGLNLSSLFPGEPVPCFSSFLTDTRTSASNSAELKDFANGNLNTCGSITIHKDAQPDDASQPFPFSATGGLSPATFSLTDPGSATQPFDNLQPGTYSITEGSLPGGWSLSNINCTKSGPGTSFSRNNSTMNITLGLAGHVDCIYVNTFTKQTPTVTTDIHAGAGANDAAGAAAILSAAIGSTVHDKAAVAGVTGFPAPTGTVSFSVYAGVTDCSGSGTAAGTNVALVGGVAHPSGDVVVPAGGLSFKAHYNGDTKYNAADGPCEPLTGNRLSSSTVTDIHAGAGANDAAGAAAILSAAIGSTVHDKATVSGALTTPTGTVNFTVYTNATDCTGASQAAGTNVPLVGGVAHPSSDAVVGVNGLSFKAHYNGDATYLASDGLCEPLTPTSCRRRR